jgi:hypothetical protein
MLLKQTFKFLARLALTTLVRDWKCAVSVSLRHSVKDKVSRALGAPAISGNGYLAGSRALRDGGGYLCRRVGGEGRRKAVELDGGDACEVASGDDDLHAGLCGGRREAGDERSGGQASYPGIIFPGIRISPE